MVTTVPDDVRERVTSYIKHQARKQPAELRAIVEEGHGRLMALLDAMSDEQARFKPAPDEWCALEVMAHVVTAKRGVARICERLGRGERPGTFGGEGEDRSRQDGVTGVSFSTAAEARDAAQREHQALLAFIDTLSPATNLEARYRHFVFGDLNSREWAAFQRVHDGDHEGQIKKIIEAPGYPR
jgi:hypothetical protein